MEIQVKDLMSENEMLSHIFFGCIPKEQIRDIRDRYVGKIDWRKDSVTIPVEMSIGGVPVNPKEFFDSWKKQMNDLISERAKKLVEEKLGSQKMRDMQEKLYEFERILLSWESEINWESENPFV